MGALEVPVLFTLVELISPLEKWVVSRYTLGLKGSSVYCTPASGLIKGQRTWRWTVCCLTRFPNSTVVAVRYYNSSCYNSVDA